MKRVLIIKFQADIIICILEKWAREWHMSFNVSKCSIMYIGNTNIVDLNNIINYTLNEQNITTRINRKKQ